MRLKPVGSVLSRSEVDPFLYVWYHAVWTQNGLAPMDVQLTFGLCKQHTIILCIICVNNILLYYVLSV